MSKKKLELIRNLFIQDTEAKWLGMRQTGTLNGPVRMEKRGQIFRLDDRKAKWTGY